MRRRVLVGLSVALGVAMLCYAVVLLWPAHDPNRVYFDRVQIGMPQQEAEDLLSEAGFRGDGGVAEGGRLILLYTKDGATVVLSAGLRENVIESKEYLPQDTLYVRLCEWLGI